MKILKILFLISTSIISKTFSCTQTRSKTYHDGSYILCHNMTLSQYKQEIGSMFNYRTPRELEIVQIDISTIDYTFYEYSSYDSIYNLTIKQCGVTTIESNCFNKFSKLQYLYIMENNIKYFNGHFIISLSSLNMLDISSNRIQQFNIYCTNNDRFSKLVISNNSITSIKNNTFNNCDYLKFLNMSGNKIKTMEYNEFNEIGNIETLDLSTSNITIIDERTFNDLSKLRNLYLDNNNISNLKFLGINSLQTLSLANNPIKTLFFNTTSLNSSIFKGLENLENLDLSNLNMITVIEPETFKELNHLRTLNLRNNNISALYKNSFGGLNSLETLILAENPNLKIEPFAFQGLLSLRSFILNSNKLKTLPCGTFPENNIIQSLNVSNNELESIRVCAFHQLRNLRSLDLARNRLRELGVGSLSALAQLQALNLSGNALASLSEAVLHPLEELQELDISANRFTHLDPSSLFGHLTHLHQVDLSGNRWSCQNLTLVRKHLKVREISYRARILNFTAANIGGIQCIEDLTRQIQTSTEDYSGNDESNETMKVLIKELSHNIMASPPGGAAGAAERRVPVRDDPATAPRTRVQLAKQGSLTIVRRSNSSGRRSPSGGGMARATGQRHSPPADMDASAPEDADAPGSGAVNLAADNLPAVDTPDACDKAALRLRGLLCQLQSGEVSAEVLQRNLQYAARVLEAVFIDETRTRSRTQPEASPATSAPSAPVQPERPPATAPAVQRRRLRAPVWARRLADEDDELSEVQPDAVPPEVREWLASTFTRQLATTRRKADEKPKFRSVAHAIRAGIFVDRMYRRVGHAALMQFPAEVARALKNLDEWNFDVFSLSEASGGQPVKYIGYDLLNRYGMIHKFKVPPTVLEAFLVRVEEGYCRYGNPYHNNIHAADVSQTVHFMLCQTGLMNWMTDLEIFATLVAALIHDFEHTGTTNNFHVMSGSETALLYNDRAVLENHHLSLAFRLMKDDECNVAQNLSREEYREFRTLIIDMVLATDMSFHFQQLKNMRNLLSLAEPTIDKSKALSLVLHVCDISHPSKNWDLHRRWTAALLEEFFRQGDMEKELGLPFSPLCDRNNTLVAESQIGFIEFIVEPSMSVCGDMLEAILAPPEDAASSTSAPSTASSTGSVTSTTPSSEFKIPKPWTECLAQNKAVWKDQAAKDAEIRAQQAQKEEDEKEDKAEE